MIPSNGIVCMDKQTLNLRLLGNLAELDWSSGIFLGFSGSTWSHNRYRTDLQQTKISTKGTKNWLRMLNWHWKGWITILLDKNQKKGKVWRILCTSILENTRWTLSSNLGSNQFGLKTAKFHFPLSEDSSFRLLWLSFRNSTYWNFRQVPTSWLS